MFYIYLYIFICLLIFWNDSGNFKNLQPMFLADFGSFSEDFYVYTVYTRYFFGPKHQLVTIDRDIRSHMEKCVTLFPLTETSH